MQSSDPLSLSEMLERATELHQQGQLAEAERAYTQILTQDSRHFVALHRLAIVALQQGRLEEALRRVDAALEIDPDAKSALMNRGTILHALERHEEALATYGRVLAGYPEDADVHFNLGNAQMAAGRLASAAESFARAHSLRPGDVEALRRQAAALTKAGQMEEALQSIDRAIAIEPGALHLQHDRAAALMALQRYQDAIAAYERLLAGDPDNTVIINNRGLALLELGRPQDALAAFDGAIALKPHDLDLWYNRGNALTALEQIDAALESYDRVLAIDPNHTRSLINRGNLLGTLSRADEALACFERAVQVVPDDAAAHTNMGNALRSLRRYDQALAAHERALAFRPDLIEAHINRGLTLKDLNRTGEALDCYERALAIRPDHAEAYYNRGLALADLDRHEQAVACFEKALAAAPEHRYAFGALADAALHACDWDMTEALGEQMEMHVRNGRSIISPFALLGYHDRPDLQLRCSRAYMADRFPRDVPSLRRSSIQQRPRIRIAYLSADFQRHATSFLMAELFELHDRDRFEVIGISWGADDGSAMRTRLCKAFDRFLDVGSLSDRDVARYLCDQEVAIAVDLKGLTGNNRIGIFTHRPAPIQVGYLGYPATLGSSFVDYVLADPVVLPFEEQDHWTERIVHLPACYQPNDRHRPVPSLSVTRAEFGLPEVGLVFCCFNNSWKITEPFFDIWMRLLRDTPGSVLWLLDDNEAAKRNLRKQAGARGIDPARLVFAARAEPDLHLARHRLADLVLDTLPYNAHTTASDALWMATPVLSCQGRSFAARVAASLLHAVDLPELVCRNLQDYEMAARRLSTQPHTLRGIRDRLEANRFRAPLFDTARLCLDLERAYLEMWEIHRSGGSPHGFAVADLAA